MSKYKTNSKNLIYRADKGDYGILDTWKERKIRKDRKPLDTGKFIDILISELEDSIYPNYPKRKESKFGVTKEYKGKLNMYSGQTYIVFPHKNANIASLNQDSFTAYFDKAQTHFENAIGVYSHELDLPGIVDEFLSQSYEVENNQSIFKWNENKWKKLKEVIENKRTEPSITGKEAEIISELFLFVVKIERYFSDLEGGD